jgi:hypothetical protein
LLIERSGEVTGTPKEEELLARFVSDGDETVAVLVMVVPTPPVTFTTRVNCAEALAFIVARVQLTVPALPTAGVVHVKTGPVFCVREANVVLGGSTSFIATVSAAVVPPLVTVMVYEIVVPTVTAPGGAVLVIERSGEVTGAPKEEELLPGVGSDADETVAVLVMVVPTPPVTFTTRVNCAESPAFIVASVQFTVPALPTAGEVHVKAGPVFCVREANVVLAGSTSDHATVCAASGPLFWTVMVYAAVVPTVIGPAGPVFTIDMSADATCTAEVAELLAGLGSPDVDVAVAVFVMVVPGLPVTFTTRLNCAEAPGLIVASEQLTVPPASTGGVVHAKPGPVFCVREVNVVPAGKGSFQATSVALSGPLFAMAIV